MVHTSTQAVGVVLHLSEDSRQQFGCFSLNYSRPANVLQEPFAIEIAVENHRYLAQATNIYIDIVPPLSAYKLNSGLYLENSIRLLYFFFFFAVYGAVRFVISELTTLDVQTARLTTCVVS